MSHALSISYAGTPYLDRTQPLRSGEIVPSGITIDFQPLRWGHGTIEALEGAQVDVAEVPLAYAFALAASNDDRFVALPIFPARAFPFTFLKSSADAPVDDIGALLSKRIGVRAGDETIALWARSFLESMTGRSCSDPWRSVDSDALQRGQVGEDFDVVVTTQSDGPFSHHAVTAVHRRDREAFDATGIFPILTTVLLRREVYQAHRWSAAALVDAFCESKEIGNRRLRYFGALAVLLPWLQTSLDEVDERFAGDAFPYGLGRNEPTLSAFEKAWTSQTQTGPGVNFGEFVTPEVRSHPGVPESTFYVVPMSRV